jgi:hypothetical protein
MPPFSVKLNSRGQEAAPFELLIAVIIMGFVLAVGLMATGELMKKECQGKMDNTMKELKVALETVAKGQGQPTFDFDLPTCYDSQKSKFIIRNITDRIPCSMICGGNRLDCTVLEFFGSSATTGYVTSVCLDIPATVDFPKAVEGGPCDPSKYEIGSIKYRVISWKDEPIMPGTYLLVNEYGLTSDYPRVCVYQRYYGS